jgi:UDP-N-acetylglucosamine 1-carboxyvinyltransferase
LKNDMISILRSFEQLGVKYHNPNESTLCISPSILKSKNVKIRVGLWPGFPTDLLSPLIVLTTQAQGTTLCHDWMYESRMFFVDKLIAMGAQIIQCDPHRVLVSGPSKLRGQELSSPDIRAGIALVVAALTANGQSIISHAELIDHGYENIAERLGGLGAKIRRVE